MTYYIDPISGRPGADGLSPEHARSGYTDLDIRPGDRILFRRGTFLRERLLKKPGAPGAYVYYGAYGEGRAPVFCGSVDVSAEADWVEIRENVWRLRRELPNEACNFIYDNGRIGATLRWNDNELTEQGDWYDSRIGSNGRIGSAPDDVVLLCSFGNPGRVYSHIECAVWGGRNMTDNADYTIMEDLAFFGSGVHGSTGGADHVIIRRCSFSFIGGAVWNRTLRIRFGNAIEFWDHGEDVLIEDCYFNNIYDSCITEQGGDHCLPATGFVMRNNLFLNYGMGAYEGRDRMMVDSVFADNLCFFAGGGFSGFGDTKPRNSEIYPQPMGHHLFIWRIDRPSERGSFDVTGNVFHEATGAAVYAIIDDAADAQMRFAGNTYFISDPALLNRRGSRTYTTEEYKAAGEPGAVFAPTDPRTAIRAWFEKTHTDDLGLPIFTDELPRGGYFRGSTERDALSYRPGEDMCFRLTLTRGEGAVSCPKFQYQIEGDDGKVQSGDVSGESGTITLHTSCARPGWVHVRVTPCDALGEPLKDCEPFNGGAVAGFDEIRKTGKTPEDLLPFWQRVIREELDPVAPVVLAQNEFQSGDPGDVVYDISVACPGPKPMTGYLRLPRNAADGSLPIVVMYSGYGVYSTPVPTKEAAIRLAVNPHGIENGREQSYYEELARTTLAEFGFDPVQNEEPDTVYFKAMILRALQAIRYCKTLPCWDGKTVRVSGGSMGAFQAVFAAALDATVTGAELVVPWLCDLRGIEDGRLRGWRPDASKGMDYYDTASMATFVRCRMDITAGFGDGVCPASGVAALFHNLNCEKHLTMYQNKHHLNMPLEPITSQR